MDKQEREQRKKAMENLRYNERMSYQQIADIFGLSRERIRQIIGSSGRASGGFNYSAPKNTLMNTFGFVENTLHLTNRELGEVLGVSKNTAGNLRKGMRHRVEPGSAIEKGIRVEEWVSKKLTDLGFENKLFPCGYPYDILVNGELRIDVKSAYKKGYTTPEYYGWKYYIKNTVRKGEADFVVCVIVPTEETFVIPRSAMPPKASHIIIFWPTIEYTTKWGKYFEAWDLLKT
jgi:transcriptional regulator with XRE-family HTH domain